ncbi:hypothetical protein BN59_00212 [Legionella massiliensis]|uniref:Uncharacterized protein n=1 Tax=Legionella massiliensis TaxID=1034943 RepID=A0A078KNP8_9GAMM|nr:hypothetical protein BN59_00212 [Legionella massiliensis]CEE11688.1 hypothetical protein BN1094_00212 [Legionella massiliensis]
MLAVQPLFTESLYLAQFSRKQGKICTQIQTFTKSQGYPLNAKVTLPAPTFRHPERSEGSPGLALCLIREILRCAQDDGVTKSNI